LKSQNDSNPKRLLRASWVMPMDAGPIRDGAVVFSGKSIVEVGLQKQLASRHPDAELIDRIGCTVLPGLVNAHTHLELSEFTPGPKPRSFVDWVLQLVPRGTATLESVQESVRRSVPIGVEQCLRFGVTCIGDISRHCMVTRAMLKDGPLRVVSYGEVLGMGQRRFLLDERIATAIDPCFESARLRIGITPHAPYSVEPEGYRRCLQVARDQGLPFATHLAETVDEKPFLASHSGSFRDLWNTIGGFDDDVPTVEGGPIRMAESVGLLSYGSLLAHVNYCDDDELEILSRGRASVVYCPRTHAYFAHPPHRWRQMLDRGINVAVGTDSCASSPDLNLIDELRLLRKLARDFDPSRLWELATVRAARAVCMEGSIGSLTPGKAADIVLFETRSEQPLVEILDANLLPNEVWIAGERV